MFVGVHERQLDERGRVALPSPFRADLGEHCYLFIGDDGCVTVRSEESFQAQAADVIEQVRRGEVSRDRKRAFASSAVHAAIDKQGRVTLDGRLREHAGIEQQGTVMVLGSLDQIEIWHPDAYRRSEQQGQQEIAGGTR